MAVHVAVLRSPFDRLLIEGRKRIELRLSKVACPPYGRIAPGDRVYVKRSAGPFVARAEVSRVLMVDCLTPKDIDQLRRQYDRWICGTDEYWQSKRDAKFAVLIWMRNVQACDFRPAYRPQNMRAWYVLDDDADAELDAPRPEPTLRFVVPLTPGGLRNDYVRVTGLLKYFPEDAVADEGKRRAKPVTLELVDGPTLETDIVRMGQRSAMFRTRAWADWFEEHGVESTDRLRFERRGTRTYLVTIDAAR